ncbi:agrin-like, partial [Plakobranchus ocellatus]
MCGGSTPLIDPATGTDYDCSPGMDTCPDGSYCHYNLQFAKCCKELSPEVRNPPITKCSETEFGCCKDGKTPARGAGAGGCP